MGGVRETETYSRVSKQRNQGLIPSAPSEKMRVRNRLESTATEMSGRLNARNRTKFCKESAVTPRFNYLEGVDADTPRFNYLEGVKR